MFLFLVAGADTMAMAAIAMAIFFLLPAVLDFYYDPDFVFDFYYDPVFEFYYDPDFFDF